MFSSWFSSLQFLGWMTSSPCRRTHSTICKHGALEEHSTEQLLLLLYSSSTSSTHGGLRIPCYTFALRKKRDKKQNWKKCPHWGWRIHCFCVFNFFFFLPELNNKLSWNTEGLCFSRLSPPAHTREYATAAAKFWENLSHYCAGLLHPWWSSSELPPRMKQRTWPGLWFSKRMK